VNPLIYLKKFNQVSGLARLLLLEKKLLKEVEFQGHKMFEQAKPVPRAYSYRSHDDLEEMMANMKNDPYQKERIRKFEDTT
jgi:hypothetical protein